MTRKYTVGIVGGGKVAFQNHMPVLANMPEVEVVYVADVNLFNVQMFEAAYGIRGIQIREDLKVLPDTDILLLATPVGARKAYIEEFGKRGAAILSEKPFAPDTESHYEFLKMSNKIACNYMRRYYSSVRQLHILFHSGIFGGLKGIKLSEGGIITKTGREKSTYQTQKELSGGGILIELGSHTLSQIESILTSDEFIIMDSKIVFNHLLDVHLEAEIKFITKYGDIPLEYELSYIKPQINLARFFFENAEVQSNLSLPSDTLRILSNNLKESFFILPPKGYALTSNQAFYLRWKDFLNKIDHSMECEFETSLFATKVITEVYNKGVRM